MAQKIPVNLDHYFIRYDFWNVEENKKNDVNTHVNKAWHMEINATRKNEKAFAKDRREGMFESQRALMHGRGHVVQSLAL